MTAYQLKVTPVTPLHIGDGDELEAGLDYLVRERPGEKGPVRTTYRLDVDRILEANADRLQSPRGGYALPCELLKGEDFQTHPEYFRYAASGAPRSGKVIAKLRSCIKDAHDLPYIPGSSLKGALRTALAWTGWGEVKPRLDRTAIGTRKERAGQDLEHTLFGPNPNRDLLRALQISDCTLAPGAKGRYMIINAQVITQRNLGSPVELEAVASNQVFSGRLSIDDYLFSAAAEGELHFSNRRHWLDELIPRLQTHSQARLKMLEAWFQKRIGAAEDSSDVLKFYQELLDSGLADNQALIQVGWGAGWDAKTFSTHLQKNQNLFEQLIRDFRLQKTGRDGSSRQPGDPFPTSRRVIMRGSRPIRPLGWVLFELDKLG